jgi:hypothetical protein
MIYSLSDPNRLPLTWENIDEWINTANPCGEGINMFTINREDWEAIYTINPDKADFGSEMVQYFMEKRRYNWACLFILYVLTISEAKQYADFALTLIPEIIPGENEEIDFLVSEAYIAADEASTNTAKVKIVVSNVERINALLYPDRDTYDILISILNYGISLLEGR